ncbi:MAG: metallophosphoesterase [Candidatus Scatosoma sp.]
MSIYAIGDLHLSFDDTKPMDVFSRAWEGHFAKISADWKKKATAEDTVLIPGDISWAMKLSDALKDLARLKELPGKKVFIRGNHDFWWNGITKLRDCAPDETFYFLQTDAVKIGRYVFAGSRGWTCPGSPDFSAEDEKLYRREAQRFRLALNCAKNLQSEGDEIVALIHYPPFSLRSPETEFTRLFEEYGVKKAVFGHLHGATYFPLKTEKNGVEYYLTSCDKTAFCLTQIE